MSLSPAMSPYSLQFCPTSLQKLFLATYSTSSSWWLPDEFFKSEMITPLLPVVLLKIKLDCFGFNHKTATWWSPATILMYVDCNKEEPASVPWRKCSKRVWCERRFNPGGSLYEIVLVLFFFNGSIHPQISIKSYWWTERPSNDTRVQM